MRERGADRVGVLDDILAQKREEIPRLRSARLPAPPDVPTVDLARNDGAPLRLICEIKRRSPSAGVLSTKLDVATRARIYAENGAAMVSVLCDRKFFDGGYEFLTEARRGCSLPLLCKEFILDESQLDHARAYGASAALLIVRCLRPTELERLIAGAEERGLVPLVEVTTEEESRVALGAGARYVGVNARDLDTLVMDAVRARRVLEALPPGVVRCHFSGVRTPDDVAQVRDSGADAALIGEVLMRLDDPADHLRQLSESAR